MYETDSKVKGKIEKIKPYLDILIANDYRIGKPLYDQVPKQENEWEQKNVLEYPLL